MEIVKLNQALSNHKMNKKNDDSENVRAEKVSCFLISNVFFSLILSSFNRFFGKIFPTRRK